ncbi:MAG: B12-binding domain-containing radical SAM protein [Candidatus Bathyarchaeota archaeon]|nr:B12-binding domain-containing radical SAM protein [Candidatus Bathyarchaeota archaeon]
MTLIGYDDEENLGLRSIAAYLDKHNVKVSIEAYKKKASAQTLKHIRESKPRLVGFSLIFQPMFMEFAALLKYLRLNGVTAHFTMGGHFPTIQCEKTLELIPELDTVVRHEGEVTLLDLFRNLDNADKWIEIKGIAFRKNGKICLTSPRPLIEDLDSLPFPVRRCKVQKYRGVSACSILASRGCYYNCSFCSVRQFYGTAPGSKRRARSPSNVAEEMQQLFKKGMRIFKFVDDDLGMKTQVQKDWISNFASELRTRGIGDKILWRISNRVDELDLECLRMLEEVGLAFVYMGIESGSNQGLRICNKHYSVKDIYNALEILAEAAVRFDYGFMMLTPGTTFESIEEDLEFLKNLTANGRAIVHFTKMLPYAGTAIEQQLKDAGRLEGTLDYPTYRYLDPRLNLMEAFLVKTFHEAIFGESALVNQLRMLLFDIEVIKKFYPEKYRLSEYAEAVKNAVTRYNESAIETIEMALKFMRQHSYDDILYYWDALDFLTQQELAAQSKVDQLINTLTPNPA